MKYNPQYVASHIPPSFISDGCSDSPDSICGYDIRAACKAHDAASCQRLWPMGSLDQEWRAAADRQLGIDIRAALPYGLDWIAWFYWKLAHAFDAPVFESCGPKAGNRCRHNQFIPTWMAR